MIYNPNEKIEIPKIGVPTIGVPKIPLPNVFGSVVRERKKDDGEKYIEISVNPYIIMNAAWNVNNGILAPGWKDADIAVVPVPDGVDKIYLSLNNDFPADMIFAEKFYSGDGGLRFYAANPLKNPSIYRAWGISNNYLVQLDGNEKYMAAYTRLKWNQYDYNYNNVVRVRFYYKGAKPNIEPPISTINSLMHESALLTISNLSETKKAENITLPSQAFDTLTEEEIALATSKGWSVVSA